MPRPKTAGIFIIIAALLALIAGHMRGELVLTFFGTVFLAITAYFYLAVFITGIMQRKKAGSIVIEIISKQIRAGEPGELLIRQAPKFFKIPGTFIRYRMKLATRDGRIAACLFNPAKKNESVIFPVPGRGAYYGVTDELLLLDAPGFFEMKIKTGQDRSSGLLAAPNPADEAIPLRIRSGGSEKSGEINYQKTDNLTENRPYVPGDDPRRINWKLYGHGPNSELYVREGENSPPPHSKILILLDTQIDPGLYGAEESLNEVDMLCENALKASEELGQRGIETLFGYTGGKIHPGTAGTLALPAALPLLSDDVLPKVADDAGILILALPRMTTGATALDKCLGDLESMNKKPDLFFLFTESNNKTGRTEAAAACAAFYKRKANVYSYMKEN